MNVNKRHRFLDISIRTFLFIIFLFGVWGYLFVNQSIFAKVPFIGILIISLVLFLLTFKHPVKYTRWINDLALWFRFNQLDLLISILLMIGAFIVFRLTMAPGFVDINIDSLFWLYNLISVTPISYLGTTPYSLYFWAAEIFGFLFIKDSNFWVNFVSLFFAVLNVPIIYFLCLRLKKLLLKNEESNIFQSALWSWAPRLLSITLTSWYVFCWLYWMYALIIEVLVVNVFFVLITLTFLFWWLEKKSRWALIMGFFTFGLSLGTHSTNILLAPGLVLLVVMEIPRILHRKKLIFQMAIAFLVGISQFIWVPFTGNDYKGSFIFSIINYYWSFFHDRNHMGGTFSAFSTFLSLRDTTFFERIIEVFGAIIDQFGWIGIIFGCLGIFFITKRHLHLSAFLFVSFVIQVLFYSQTRYFDWRTYLLVMHLNWALFIFAGLLMCLTWLKKMFKNSSYQFKQSMIVLLFSGCLVSTFIPIHNNWSVVDLSEASYIDDFCEHVLYQLPDGSVLYDQMYSFEFEKTFCEVYTQQDADIYAEPYFHVREHEVMEGQFIAIGYVNDEMRERDTSIFLNGNCLAPVLYGNYGPDVPENYSGSKYPQILYQVRDTDSVYQEKVLSQSAAETYISKDFGKVTFNGYSLHSPIISEDMLTLDMYWTIEDLSLEQPSIKVVVWLREQAIGEFFMGEKMLTDCLAERITHAPFSFHDAIRMIIPSTIPDGETMLSLEFFEGDDPLGISIPLELIIIE